MWKLSSFLYSCFLLLSFYGCFYVLPIFSIPCYLFLYTWISFLVFSRCYFIAQFLFRYSIPAISTGSSKKSGEAIKYFHFFKQIDRSYVLSNDTQKHNRSANFKRLALCSIWDQRFSDSFQFIVKHDERESCLGKTITVHTCYRRCTFTNAVNKTCSLTRGRTTPCCTKFSSLWRSFPISWCSVRRSSLMTAFRYTQENVLYWRRRFHFNWCNVTLRFHPFV